jgi:hypothetical protein
MSLHRIKVVFLLHLHPLKARHLLHLDLPHVHDHLGDLRHRVCCLTEGSLQN